MKAVYVLCSPLSVDFGGEAEHALHSAGSGIFFQLFRKVVLYSHTIFFHNISISPILSPLRNPTPTDLWTLIGGGDHGREDKGQKDLDVFCCLLG